MLLLSLSLSPDVNLWACPDSTPTAECVCGRQDLLKNFCREGHKEVYFTSKKWVEEEGSTWWEWTKFLRGFVAANGDFAGFNSARDLSNAQVGGG